MERAVHQSQGRGDDVSPHQPKSGQILLGQNAERDVESDGRRALCMAASNFGVFV